MTTLVMTRMFPVMKSIKGPGIEISSEKNKEEKQIIAVSAGGVLLEQICLGSSSNWSISAPGSWLESAGTLIGPVVPGRPQSVRSFA